MVCTCFWQRWRRRAVPRWALADYARQFLRRLQLSLQSHVHRAEHWVVVEGTATVTIGRDEKLLSENQSVYIPLGEVHRLSNNGKVPLRLIEVQTGSYLGEDDIVRYEDIYARA